jgi:hypothetical protein
MFPATATRPRRYKGLPKLPEVPEVPEVPGRRLRGWRLEAADFRGLVRPEATRDLQRWIDDPEAVRARLGGAEWEIFRGICGDERGFDPDADGVLGAAEWLRLGENGVVSLLVPADSYEGFGRHARHPRCAVAGART